MIKSAILILILLSFKISFTQDTRTYASLSDSTFEIGSLIKIENIFYEYAKADLLPESYTSLNKLIHFLNQHKELKIEVGNHTDCRGSKNRCYTLSFVRAKSIVEYLIKHGISQERLSAKGYEDTVPYIIQERDKHKHPKLMIGQELSCKYIHSLKSDDEKEILHQLNRRTEIRIIARL